MTDWPTLLLAAIAAATVTMAVVQVAVIVYGIRLAQRMNELTDRFERDLKPLLEKLTAVGEDASRVSALTLAQVERADALFRDVAGRVEQTAATLQATLAVPAREGMAVVTALKAVMAALRSPGGSPKAAGARVDEDEQLFIG